MCAAGELPGYPVSDRIDSCFAERMTGMDMTEYFSGENDALERRLEALWADEPQMRRCIPLLLAAVEKSREQEKHALLQTELYNYMM